MTARTEAAYRAVRNAVLAEVADEMRERSGNPYDAAAANLTRYYGDGQVLL